MEAAEVREMAPYKKMYLRLFNYVTDALRELEKGEIEKACEILKQAQIETEDLYVNGEDKIVFLHGGQ